MNRRLKVVVNRPGCRPRDGGLRPRTGDRWRVAAGHGPGRDVRRPARRVGRARGARRPRAHGCCGQQRRGGSPGFGAGQLRGARLVSRIQDHESHPHVASWRQSGVADAVGRHPRGRAGEPGGRVRTTRQRLHHHVDPRRGRRAVGRSGRDGGSARADGRSGRADLRRRLPGRASPSQESDSADPLAHQLLCGRVSRGGHGARGGHHQARHGRLAQPPQLRLPRRVAQRHATRSPSAVRPSS